MVDYGRATMLLEALRLAYRTGLLDMARHRQTFNSHDEVAHRIADKFPALWEVGRPPEFNDLWQLARALADSKGESTGAMLTALRHVIACERRQAAAGAYDDLARKMAGWLEEVRRVTS